MKREYFCDPDSQTPIAHNMITHRYTVISQNSKEENKLFLQIFEDNYPENYKALEKHYAKHVRKRYMMARRGILCNFMVNDNTPDVDEDGVMHPEFVPCPLRCECKLGFCSLVERKLITEKELSYLKLSASGMEYLQIADEMGRTLENVKATFKRMYRRLGFSGTTAKAQLISYAKDHQLI